MINWNGVIAVAASFSAGLFAYLSARNTDKTTLKKATDEVEVNLSKTNNEQSIALFQQYQKMNENLQMKFDKIQEKMEKMEEEFRNFRFESEKEKTFLLNKVEDLEEKNEELMEENGILRTENNRLIGGF